MKIVVDMNLSPYWVTALRGAGIEANHWSELGDCAAPDPEIMEHARATDSVILTKDLDFGGHLALTRVPKPSIVQLRMDELDPLVVGDFVISILLGLRDELGQGALITIRADRTRLRLLPFPSEG